MKRIDKIKNINKVNLLAEQRYLQAKGFFKENIDIALDNLLKSGDFNDLSEVDKVILFAAANDIKKLKQIDLLKFYKDNGNSFGDLKLRIKVKEANEQPIKQRYSLENAGKIGYVLPRLMKSPDGVYYVFVKLEEGVEDDIQFGGEYHQDVLILLDNMYPLSYGEPTKEFEKFMDRHNYELRNFRKDNDLPPDGLSGFFDDLLG
jgi:hypothetical protein